MSREPLMLLFILHILSSSIIAQKNFTAGAIILNNGDTLKGYIDYREWHTNPESILFTAAKEKKGVIYKKSDIGYFEITAQEAYKRYLVRISMDPETITSISDKDTSARIDTVFLKVLHQGKNLTLLSYTDKLKTRFYVLQKDKTGPVELLNSIYLNNDQVVEEKQYRMLLRDFALKYMPSDNDLLNKIDGAGYYQQTIEAIFYRLNNAEKQIIKQARVNRISPFSFFAGIGLNMGTLKFAGDNRYTGNNTSPFYYPVAIFGVDMFIKPSVGRLFLRAQVQVTGFKTDAYTFKEYYPYKYNYYFKFSQANISIIPQVLYNMYNEPSFKWFAGVGSGLNFSFYPQNVQKTVRESSSSTTVDTDDKYIDFLKTFWLNLSFRTGIVIKKFEASVLFFPKSSISQYGNFELANSSLQLQVNYLFR